jgi:hypothetical protein
MSIEIRYSVMSPQPQAEKIEGGLPPGMGVPPGKVKPAGLSKPSTPSPALPLAKRLDTLENKTVYLVDTGFGGGYKFMIQLQKWFSRHIPSAHTIRKRKTGGPFMDDTTDLWEEIKARGDAVVLGVGG